MSDERDREPPPATSAPAPRGVDDARPARHRRRRRRAPEGAVAQPQRPATDGAPSQEASPAGEHRRRRRHRQRRSVGAAAGPDAHATTARPDVERPAGADDHAAGRAEAAGAPPRRRGKRRRGHRGERGERQPAEQITPSAIAAATTAPATAAAVVEGPGLAFPDKEAWEISTSDAVTAAAAAVAATPAPAVARAASSGPRVEDAAAERPHPSSRPRPSPASARQRPAAAAESSSATEDGDGCARAPLGPSILDVAERPLDPDGEDELDELDADAPPEEGRVYRLALVRMRDRVRACELDAGELQLARGDSVVVETEQGLTLGSVEHPCRRACCPEPPRRVVRRLDGNDLRQQARNLAREREAFQYCRERVRQRGLPMKLIRVEYLHGGNKAVFYFAAENRVDFRELVKDLAGRLHTRIVMRQVGVRDEAKMTGGIGSCGCDLCCATWLPKFEPVSIRMAKDQNLVLNPQKVSGQCGRLKCCLAYEDSHYLHARKGLPKVGRRVKTPDGEGKVQDVDILRQLVRVHRDDGNDEVYLAAEVQQLQGPPAGGGEQHAPREHKPDGAG